MLKKHSYTIAFIGWMMFITSLSLFSLPGDDVPQFKIPNADKAVHFAFYFIASVLGCFFLRERTTGSLKLNKAIFIIVISMVIYGTIIEVIQSNYTVYRTGDIYDALANSLGAFSGAIIIKLLFSGKTQLKWKI